MNKKNSDITSFRSVANKPRLEYEKERSRRFDEELNYENIRTENQKHNVNSDQPKKSNKSVLSVKGFMIGMSVLLLSGGYYVNKTNEEHKEEVRGKTIEAIKNDPAFEEMMEYINTIEAMRELIGEYNDLPSGNQKIEKAEIITENYSDFRESMLNVSKDIIIRTNYLEVQPGVTPEIKVIPNSADGFNVRFINGDHSIPVTDRTITNPIINLVNADYHLEQGNQRDFIKNVERAANRQVDTLRANMNNYEEAKGKGI